MGKPADRILSIADRLGANRKFLGRGITTAFLDSGFFAHQDLTRPRQRIVAFHDLLSGRSGIRELARPDVSSWHGMMTTVVAAGNGYLSDGYYRSLAPEMKLVLLKVGEASRISHDAIREGIAWVIKNRLRYDIRILNISCGGDYEASYLRDALSRKAEDAVRAGITVIAAVGNAGMNPDHPVLPPASVPAVISIGGMNDRGDPSLGRVDGYRSSFGPTVDGLQKPEIIATAIYVAAPILPGTPTKEEADLLVLLRKTDDERLSDVIRSHPGVSGILDEARDLPTYLLRKLVDARYRGQSIISGHYKHVDGTSFAAPIAASVAAQMLEANPELTPLALKRLLLKTARRLPGVEPERQGFGVLRPAAAVEAALASREKIAS